VGERGRDRGPDYECVSHAPMVGGLVAALPSGKGLRVRWEPVLAAAASAALPALAGLLGDVLADGSLPGLAAGPFLG